MWYTLSSLTNRVISVKLKAFIADRSRMHIVAENTLGESKKLPRVMENIAARQNR